jgi:hypothetical protein
MMDMALLWWWRWWCIWTGNGNEKKQDTIQLYVPSTTERRA